MRTGVHYLSMGAAGFLLVFLGIGVLKYLLFALLFALSAGKLSFWLFPNLTEDVGFLESFMPVYDYSYTGKSFKKKKAKDSDDEESDDEEDEEDENADNEDSDSGAVDKKAKDSDDEESDDDEDEEDENADNEDS